MFKSIALFACVIAVVVAEPGYLGDAYALGHGYGYGGHGYSSYGHAVIPAAVSHQSSVAVHTKPIITAVAAAPVIVKPHLVAALPAATSHQSRVDIHSKPIVYTKPIVSYAVPHLSHSASYVAAAPIVSGLHGSGYHGLGG